MRVVITGAGGFIGSALCARLLQSDHFITVLSRFPEKGPARVNRKWVTCQPGQPGPWEEALDGADAVINLAGEPIAKRWTSSQKERIRFSRIEMTRALVEAVAKVGAKPKVFLSGSAIGYYGPRGDDAITEDIGPGRDFLAQLCVEWEEQAQKAEAYGVRVVRLRTGIVLGKGGGALAKMLPPFRFFIGGPLADGKQWISWIHIEDEVGLILHLLQKEDARGAVNATAPNPVTNSDFSQTLGKVLHRPSWTPVPGFALRLLMGEMAELVLTGQRVLPVQAQRLGYSFRYPTLVEALQATFSS